jgi:hypothetical protein
VFAGEYLQVTDANGGLGHASPFGARLFVVPQNPGYAEIDGSWALTAP